MSTTELPTHRPDVEASRPTAFAGVLLACGIVASLLYVIANIVGDVVWDAYSLKTFTVSELSALDAPSRPVVPVMMFVFGALSLAFAIGVVLAGRGRGLRVTGWLLVAVGVANLAGAFDHGFRVHALVTLAVMLGFGALAAADGPAIAANDPTPWVGVTERICIGAYLLWMVALAGGLLCTPAPNRIGLSSRIEPRPSSTPVHRTPASSGR